MASLAAEVHSLFALAALRREAASGLNADDWHRFQEIRQLHDAQRRKLERDFAENSGERMAQARKRLIDEAAQKPRDLVPPWAAHDRFDKTAIDHRAWREVTMAHRQEITRIDQAEVQAIDRLLDASDHRRRTRAAVKRGFAEASQERGGPSRLRRD